jgi:hypothetical protein
MMPALVFCLRLVIFGAAISGCAHSEIISLTLATLTWAAVGEFVLNTLIATALNMAVSALTKPKKTEARGSQIDFSIDPAAPRVAVFGTTRVKGSLADAWCAGDSNKWDVEVIALAEGRCSALLGFWEGNLYFPFEGNGPQSYYTRGGVPHMWVYFNDGADDQAAITGHDALTGIWTTDHRGIGVAHVVVIKLYNEKVWTAGPPSWAWHLQGLLNYVLSGDSTEGGSGAVRWNDKSTYFYTDSALDHAYHYARGVWVNGQRLIGPGLIPRDLPSARWLPEMAACVEVVDLKAGGGVEGVGWEYRYRTCAVIASDDDWAEILDEFARSVAGKRIDLGGQQVILAGVARTPVFDLTEDDLDARADFSVQAKKSARELYNAVSGTFTDKILGYITGDYPALSSSEAEEEDGDPKELTLNLPFVFSHTQAQRIRKIALFSARRQARASFTGMNWTCHYESGDVGYFSSDREGWTDYILSVERSAVGPTRKNLMQLELTSPDDFAWDETVDETDPMAVAPDATLPPGDAELVGFTLTSVQVVGDDGVEIPGLLFEWAPPTDPSIDNVRCEFRKPLDAVILEAICPDPATGKLLVTAGVVIVTEYEGRITPIPNPRRAASSSSWETATSGTSTVDDEIGDLYDTTDDLQDQIDGVVGSTSNKVGNATLGASTSINTGSFTTVRTIDSTSSLPAGAISFGSIVGDLGTSRSGSWQITEDLQAGGSEATLSEGAWSSFEEVSGSGVYLVGDIATSYLALSLTGNTRYRLKMKSDIGTFSVQAALFGDFVSA